MISRWTWAAAAAMLAAVGCGGSDAPEPTYTVGGTVRGLSGSLSLREASGQLLQIGGDGVFSLSKRLPAGTRYDIGVAEQPAAQECRVEHGSGTLTADVNDIAVLCAPRTFLLTVEVARLDQPVLLSASWGNSLALSTTGTHTFPTALRMGERYSVALDPQGQQGCTLGNATGTADSQPGPVQLSCETSRVRLGGKVQGTRGGAVALRNSDGATATVPGDGTFSFAQPVQRGSSYNVTVLDQSPGLACRVAGGSGLATADVDTIAVECMPFTAATAPPPPPAPGTPAGFTVSYDVKRYAFSWNTTAGTTHYQLFEDVDGAGPALPVQVGADLSTNSHTLTHAGLLHKRVDARYTVRACNLGSCGAPTSALQPDAARAIGYFKASNPGALDFFSYGMALSGDGNTLVVGAFREDSAATGVNGNQASNAAVDAGAAYVFVRDGAGRWTQQAYLKASNTRAGDFFGGSVAVSFDGSTVAIGAYGEDGASPGVNGDQTSSAAPDAGAVYVFTRTGASWAQQAYIKASNPGAGDYFGLGGLALSADGQTLAVGARYEDSNATGINGNQANESAVDSGAVYVFTRTGSAWSQQAYIKASNAEANDSFGLRVALSESGDTLAVSAVWEDSASTGTFAVPPADNAAVDSGAVYLFTRSAGTWSQQAYIKPSNTRAGDWFGHVVDLSADGNTLIATAYREDSAATGVGGDQASAGAADSGAVYVFKRAGNAWNQQAYIKASNTGAADWFGIAAALSADGKVLAVGASQEASGARGFNGDQANNSASNAGAAYLFTDDGTGWRQEAYLKPGNTAVHWRFGYRVSLSADGRTLAVGAYTEDGGSAGIQGDQSDASVTDAGAVFLY